MNQYLGVRLRPEPVAALQIPAKFPEIVDLAVENRPDALLLIGDGLLAPFQVDDAEAPMPQPDRAVEQEPVLVGTPMGHLGVHGPHRALHTRVG